MMSDETKTKQLLIKELNELRERNAELEKAESSHILIEKNLNESVAKLEASLAALHENEERYRLLTENTDSLICEISAESNIIYTNPAFKEILGYEKTALLGRSIKEIIHPDEVQEAIKVYTKLLEDRRPSKREWRIRRQDGAWLWFECVGNIFETHSGETHFVMISNDINERKLIETELSNNKYLIQQIIDTTPNILFIYDIVEKEPVFMNQEFYRVYGEIPQEMMNKAFFLGWIHPEDRLRVIKHYSELRERNTAEFMEIEYRVRNIDGEWRWLSSRDVIFARNPQNEPVQILSSTQDITVHKKMEEELKKAKEIIELDALRLKTIFDSMLDSVVICNTESIITQVNQKAVYEFGFDPTMKSGKILGQKMPLLHLNGERVQRDQLPPIRALKGEKVVDEYYRFKNINGKEYTVVYSSAPLELDGKIYAVVSTWHDVTERENLVTQLKNERLRLEAILEQLPLGAIITEIPSGKFILCNKQIEQIWRHPAFIARSRNDYLENWSLPDGHPQLPPILVKAISGCEALTEEVDFQRSDGTWGVIELSSAPIKDSEGKTIAGVTIITDITEQKQIEENLHLASQLQQIIEFLPDATFVLDQNKTVIAWNRAIEIMTGVNKQELLGKGNQEYSVPFYREKRPMLIDYIWDKKLLISDYRSILREDDTIYAKTSITYLPYGKERFLEMKASPLKNNQGQIIGAIESIRDITRQQEMEEEALKTQKIESIGVLAGGIAHDFNNFLTGILANIQLIGMKLEKGKDITDSLLRVQGTIKQASNLTQQLLTFSKGGAPIKKATCLKDILKDSAEFVLRGSKSKYSLVIPEDLWMIDADPGQISQVISNMVINADQSMPTGGMIKITAENMMVNKGSTLPITPGKYIRISITDTGVGIAKENLHKIFDPYFTTKETGTGLGLATSFFIISRHNGHVTVESTMGEGTAFYIYLPAIDGLSPYNNETETVLTAGHGKILLMDDEKMISEAAGEMLCEIGYEVEYAQEGSEAINLYLQAKRTGKPFDVIIADLTIPGGLGGKETVKKLREIDPTVKAIVSSGYSNDPVMANFGEYGFNGVVAKPFKIEELNEVLKQVLKTADSGLLQTTT